MTVTENIYEELSHKQISVLFWKYALPAIIGAIVSTLYNIVGGVFVGHWVGKEALSGMGVVLPLMNLTIASSMLIGVGAASRISINLGLQAYENAEKIVGTSLLLTLILSGGTVTFLFIFLKPLLMLAGASEITYPYARDYLQIFLPGGVFLSLCLSYNNMMRASGYPIKAMITMFISVIINIALAPVFILIFDLGIQGAALATVLSMMISFTFVMKHFISKEAKVKLKVCYIKLDLGIIKSILSIGLSPFCLQVASSVIVVVINYQIHRFAPLSEISSDDAIAAFSNTNRLLTLVVMIVIGINQGMQPIIGYNYGAKCYIRVKQTLAYAIKMATYVTTTGFFCAFFFPEVLVTIFSPDPEIIRLSAIALRYITLAFIGVGFQMVTTSFFQCIGMAKKSILLSLSRQLLILIPCLFILPHFLGLNGVWLSCSIADLLSIILAIFLLTQQFKKFHQTIPVS